jgi:trk system potassium uptake protein TrkH
MYFAAYFCLVIVSGFLVAIMNNHISLLSSLTAVFTCINGCGPGLDVVGPWGNFNSLTGLSKFYLCFIMLAGRLEIYPMLLLFSRRFWSPN